MSEASGISKSRNWLGIALWAAQIMLAAGYAMAGAMKLFSPLAELAAEMAYVADAPEWFVRGVGVAELAGAVGIILPAATRIMTWLTPLAAACFSVVQVVAIGIHAVYGETAQFLPFNLMLLSLSLFVLWGRWKKQPIASR